MSQPAAAAAPAKVKDVIESIAVADLRIKQLEAAQAASKAASTAAPAPTAAKAAPKPTSENEEDEEEEEGEEEEEDDEDDVQAAPAAATATAGADAHVGRSQALGRYSNLLRRVCVWVGGGWMGAAVPQRRRVRAE